MPSGPLKGGNGLPARDGGKPGHLGGQLQLNGLDGQRQAIFLSRPQDLAYLLGDDLWCLNWNRRLILLHHFQDKKDSLLNAFEGPFSSVSLTDTAGKGRTVDGITAILLRF